MTQAVAKRDETQVVEVGQALTPMELLGRAVAAGATPEMLEKLVALAERWDANAARKAFDAAMAAAKAELPVILKNREVDFTSPKGRTNYKYEDLAGIAGQIDPILAKHGLSYRFRTTSAVNEPVTVTCIMSHRDGHSEETTLSAGRDESGNKNSIQAVGSTVTYLQRYTLKAALGLAASADDDAKSAEPVEPVSDEDAQNIRDKLTAKGATEAKLITWVQRKYPDVKKIEDIPSSLYDACCTAIQNYNPPAPKEKA